MNTFLAFLLQLIAYLLLLAINAYAGSLLAMILGLIAFGIWGLSHVTEWISPSRVTREYYRYMLSAWLAPLVAVIGFILLRGDIGWL